MSDDIKEWLQKVAATDPFVKLRKFNQDNPEKPIPPELEFAALVAPILGEIEGAMSFDQELAQQIDVLMDEDDARKGGGSYKKGRLKAFAMINHLTQEENLSLEEAYEETLDQLQEEGIEDDRVNLDRAYQRYMAKKLINEIGQAISDNEQDKALKLLQELRRRHNTFGQHWTA